MKFGGAEEDPTSRRASLVDVESNRVISHLFHRNIVDQSILDAVDLGIVTAEGRGRVTFVNRSAREILEREGDLRGEDVRSLLGLPVDPDVLVGSESVRRFSHVLYVRDVEIEIDLAVSRTDESARDHVGFFFAFHDRTHEKQRDMERHRFEHLAAMGTMVAGFAHEIRNPVASLRSLAESLNDELADAQLRLPHVGHMLAVLDRMERLVRTSLVFGSPAPPRRSAHRTLTLLSAAVSSVSSLTRELGGELGVEAEPELPDVFVDDGQVVQILVILLENALDATRSAREVSIRAEMARPNEARGRKSEPPAGFVRFVVRDEGPGIGPELQARIFDPFFTTKANGTGLGLSIAQQLVTDNGGRLELSSAPGGPTTFSLCVPIAAPDVRVEVRLDRRSR